MKMKILKGHCKFCHLTSLFLVTIFVFYNTQSVNAQEVKLSAVDINNKANKLFADENYVDAVKWYRLAAEQGYSLAQYALGRCYDSGHGVKENDSEAVKWYTLAAEQGYDVAQRVLGYCYKYGSGVKKDKAEAIKWATRAAEQGSSIAQSDLAHYYYVNRNYVKAVKWFRLAAEQDSVFAQYYLGLCYEKGRGVDKNIEEAVKWYKLADADGLARKRLNKKKFKRYL
jgi:TPR repeat protein